MSDAAPISPQSPSVAIVGGGLAGMAAAAAAVARGLRVELFEQGKDLGGRAGSFFDPPSGRLADFCPHVAMGCCTNLDDFCRRAGLSECFRRFAALHFVLPGGGRYDFSARRWLPAPLHLLPGLLGLGYLARPDRWAIARAMLRLARERPDPRDEAPTIGAWLRGQGQSQQAIDRFWSVVLVSALGETLDRASLSAARKVLLDGFLASRRAWELVVPQRPLGELWQRARQWLSRLGATIQLGSRVERIEGDGRRAAAVLLADGTRRPFDFVVAAVPWWQIRKLLDPSLLAAMPLVAQAEQLEPSPITAVHLWFDRALTPLPHAAIVPGEILPATESLSNAVPLPFCNGGQARPLNGLPLPRSWLSQWVFADPQPDPARWHYQVVISASHALRGRNRVEILKEVRGELEQVWPEARQAKLLRWLLFVQPAAVFSVRPGSDRLRPAQQTPVANLLLAGDWTATGWPATMEGAVRSGYLAVEGILASLDRAERVVVKDLPRGWLVRLLGMG
jgi:squalene-associated FAD-dependent desaturase